MNRSFTTHGSWLLVTGMLFVAGSQLARRGAPLVQLGSTSHADELSGLANTLIHGTKSSALVIASEDQDNAENDSAHVIPSTTTGSSPQPRTGKTPAPLTESQINELAIAATKSSNPIERRKAFDRLLKEMQSDTFTREQAMMMRSALHENGANGEQWRAFDYAWGATDPETALAHLDEIDQTYRRSFASNMMPGLAISEPEMAIDLLNRFDGSQRFHMTSRLIEGLTDYDIGFATDYVSQLAEDRVPSAARHIGRLAHEVLSTAGFEDGIAWAEGLDSGPFQASALRRVAHEYANKAPAEAADWAKQFVGQDQNSRLFGEVVREWGDWQTANDWVESLEPSLAKQDALSAIYGFRGAQEPHQAVQDILDMPASDDRNFAINGFISGLAHQDGEAAVTWAAEITSEGMRQSAMIRAGKQFYQQDQQAATEWFNASSLPKSAWNQVAQPK
ncbi:MAG: hypothetical protein GWQ08_22865 [Verrucomicrobiaceae bacterium]|nr:hypothetical protein [Verrucomicrobiaceae bacterium]